MIKIYVDTEQEKQEILKQSEYIHDFLEVVKTKNKNGPVSVETIWKTWILDEWENKRKYSKDDE